MWFWGADRPSTRTPFFLALFDVRSYRLSLDGRTQQRLLAQHPRPPPEAFCASGLAAVPVPLCQLPRPFAKKASHQSYPTVPLFAIRINSTSSFLKFSVAILCVSRENGKTSCLMNALALQPAPLLELHRKQLAR
jgi:hypothetical protein